jgi:hypothetical protein
MIGVVTFSVGSRKQTASFLVSNSSSAVPVPSRVARRRERRSDGGELLPGRGLRRDQRDGDGCDQRSRKLRADAQPTRRSSGRRRETPTFPCSLRRF